MPDSSLVASVLGFGARQIRPARPQSGIGASLPQDWSQIAAPAVFGIAMRIYALNITAMSLRGKLDIGLVGCPDLLPDLWEMADEFAVGTEELLAHAR